MANTTYTSQEVMNRRYGSTPTSKYTVQEVANLQDGSAYPTQYSFQEVLNGNLGVHPTFYTEQEALWLTLQAELSLTGAKTQYTVQELLNMADSASVTVPGIIDDDVVGGSFNDGLLLAII